nr:hypothetical protein Saspl_046334 [Ipomoea batatas]
MNGARIAPSCAACVAHPSAAFLTVVGKSSTAFIKLPATQNSPLNHCVPIANGFLPSLSSQIAVKKYAGISATAFRATFRNKRTRVRGERRTSMREPDKDSFGRRREEPPREKDSVPPEKDSMPPDKDSFGRRSEEPPPLTSLSSPRTTFSGSSFPLALAILCMVLMASPTLPRMRHHRGDSWRKGRTRKTKRMDGTEEATNGRRQGKNGGGDVPIIHPAKNNAWTSPTRYISPQISPNSDTVELPSPPSHSHDPGSSPHTLPLSAACAAAESQAAEEHRQAGSRSAKIITIVWIPSSAHARLVNTKCLSCHHPNSPQYFCSASSTELRGYSRNPAIVNRDFHLPSSSWRTTLSWPSQAMTLTMSRARQCCSTLIRSFLSLARVTSIDSKIAE